MPTPILKSISPFEILHNKPPNYSTLKPFGCLCYPWLRPYSSSKLHPRSAKCVFLGYSSSKSAYKCYDPQTRRLFHSRHVRFIDDHFPYKNSNQHFSSPLTTEAFLSPTSSSNPTPSPTPDSQPAMQLPSLFPIPPLTISPYTTEPSSTSPSPTNIQSSSPTSHDHSSDPSSTASLTPHDHSPIQTSSASSPDVTASSLQHSPPPRQRKPNPKYYNSSFINTSTLHPLPTTYEPTTHTQALKDPEWRHAMDTEFNALLHNHTWDLVPKASHTPIGYKWVFSFPCCHLIHSIKYGRIVLCVLKPRVALQQVLKQL